MTPTPRPPSTWNTYNFWSYLLYAGNSLDQEIIMETEKVTMRPSQNRTLVSPRKSSRRDQKLSDCFQLT